MVTQAGNGGLTETIKNAISTIDRLIKYLNSIPASTYNIIGTFTRLVAEIYVINRAINAVKASSIASEISLKDLGTKGVASMETLTIAVNGLGAAFKRILPVLLATLAVEGIMYVIDSINGETDAINKESEAMTDNLAIKQQQIEVSQQQEEYVNALLDAHVKLSDAINSGTLTDKKKQQADQNLQETEKQLSAFLSQATIQRLNEDGWTQDSINAVKNDYNEASKQKRTALANLAVSELKHAQDTIKNSLNLIEAYKNDAESFINGNNDKLDSLNALWEFEVKYADWKKNKADSEYKQAQQNTEQARQAYNNLPEDTPDDIKELLS